MVDHPFARFNADRQQPTPPSGVQGGIAFRSRDAGAVAAIREVELLAAIDRVPSLPAVVQQILTKVGNGQSSAGDLEALIKRDLALAGRLLKLVNSPFYGLSQPVASIAQGVAIIGFSSLRSLVLAASAANLLAADLSVYGFAERGLWKNSIATAALARSIAERNGAGKDLGEEYFAAGLLRDVGILVLAPFIARHTQQVGRRSDGDLLHAERELCGYDHCWVGERIADKWLLPERLRLSIARHHRIPSDAGPELLRQLAAVRLAERLAYSAGVGVVPGHPFDVRIDAALVAAAGFDAPRFQELVDQVPVLVRTADIPL